MLLTSCVSSGISSSTCMSTSALCFHSEQVRRVITYKLLGYVLDWAASIESQVNCRIMSVSRQTSQAVPGVHFSCNIWVILG
jgi:hypothetical protein